MVRSEVWVGGQNAAFSTACPAWRQVFQEGYGEGAM